MADKEHNGICYVIKRTDVLNALACLKAMCATYDTCGNCPAYDGICKIKYTDPEDYELNTDGDTIWRAFK